MSSTKKLYSNLNLSVFFPAYNEQGNIKSTIEKAVKKIEDLKLTNWEVLVIDDGSKDQTLEITKELAKKNPRIKPIHQENGGYGKALRTGFSNSKFNWIVFTDADGQFDFAEITKFLDKTNQADYIIGYRIKRADNFFRLLAGKIWALSVFLMFGYWVKDIDCGFRMLKKTAYQKIQPLQSTRGAMINAEMLVKVNKQNFKIVQVGVNHYPRAAGASTGVRVNVIIKSYLELFKLWWKLK